MKFQGEIPKGFIQTGKDALRNQACYDSIMSSRAQKSTEPTPFKDGWLLIAAAIGSLFFGSNAGE